MSHVSPHARLVCLPGDAVRWRGGFWGARLDRCQVNTLPALQTALHNASNGAVLDNFRVAAGLAEGEHQGTDWGDGDCYKWLEALARVYEITRDPALDALMDEWIGTIGQAQDDDGYVCTQVQLPGGKRWESNSRHELYNMGHLLTAACVHHEVTGKDSFLQIARQLADYLFQVFMPRPPELAHFCFNPSQIMGCASLYRATGDRRYLDLAGVFVDMRGSAPADLNRHPGFLPAWMGDQTQDRVPLRDETQAVGHGVTATYLYSGAAEVFAETGEAALLEALERIWEDLTTSKLAVTGGVGELHAGASVHGGSVHEAFGAPYQLPQRTSYHETCANLGLAMWALRMLRLTGEARYAEVMERVLYNCLLSSTDLNQTHFFYTNPLARAGQDVPLLSNDTPARWATFHCYCCPPQVARTIAGLHHWAYSLSEQGLWVHLYGASTARAVLADGAPIAVEQDTDYPWDGTVTFTFATAPPGEFSLFLRVPPWASGASLTVNGAAHTASLQPGTHVELRRLWRDGDRVELHLPMSVRLVRAHPLAEELRNQVAVMRGPLAYCLEEIDLPAGVRLSEVHLPRSTSLVPRHDPGLLGGVTVLEGEAWRFADPDPEWAKALYRDLPEVAPERLAVRLIPYYAWANRGQSPMTVWLPLMQP